MFRIVFFDGLLKLRAERLLLFLELVENGGKKLSVRRKQVPTAVESRFDAVFADFETFAGEKFALDQCRAKVGNLQRDFLVESATCVSVKSDWLIPALRMRLVFPESSDSA